MARACLLVGRRHAARNSCGVGGLGTRKDPTNKSATAVRGGEGQIWGRKHGGTAVDEEGETSDGL